MKPVFLKPRPLLSKELLTELRDSAKRTVRLSRRPIASAGVTIRGIYNYTLLRVV